MLSKRHWLSRRLAPHRWFSSALVLLLILICHSCESSLGTHDTGQLSSSLIWRAINSSVTSNFSSIQQYTIHISSLSRNKFEIFVNTFKFEPVIRVRWCRNVSNILLSPWGRAVGPGWDHHHGRTSGCVAYSTGGILVVSLRFDIPQVILSSKNNTILCNRIWSRKILWNIGKPFWTWCDPATLPA